MLKISCRKLNEAERLHAELAERMQHVDHLIVCVKSSMGNIVIATSPSVTSDTIRRVIECLKDELTDRARNFG